MNTTAETALKATIRSEQIKSTYNQIRTITGHKSEKTPLTQIEILSPHEDNTRTVIATKEEMENAIMKRNQRHSRQSLQTPFANNLELREAVDPYHPNNKIEQILEGTFTNPDLPHDLSPIETEWINELKTRITSTTNETINLQDFISFFKKRKERTASSSSGRHMGHYKVIADLAKQGTTEPADLIISLINISIKTSRPLKRWRHSAQIMLEKGKGKYIENLRIIQLCEADLNFTLNIIWGYRLIRHATRHNALNTSQYALPGLTCNSAIWNKVLFCDLLRQTLSTGIMTDYDATAAFDRVLHSMSILSCRRLGLPMTSCLFMYNLLQNMEFHLITGFGPSAATFRNNDDPMQIGQGSSKEAARRPQSTIYATMCPFPHTRKRHRVQHSLTR